MNASTQPISRQQEDRLCGRGGQAPPVISQGPHLDQAWENRGACMHAPRLVDLRMGSCFLRNTTSPFNGVHAGPILFPCRPWRMIGTFRCTTTICLCGASSVGPGGGGRRGGDRGGGQEKMPYAASRIRGLEGERERWRERKREETGAGSASTSLFSYYHLASPIPPSLSAPSPHSLKCPAPSSTPLRQDGEDHQAGPGRAPDLPVHPH
jgi:hypothetical protein